MTELSNEDVDRIASAIAPKLIKGVRQERHEFWIAPEMHYRSHMDSDRLTKVFDDETIAALKELGKLHSGAKRNVWKLVYLLLFLVALLSAAIYGIFTHKPPMPPA